MSVWPIVVAAASAVTAVPSAAVLASAVPAHVQGGAGGRAGAEGRPAAARAAPLPPGQAIERIAPREAPALQLVQPDRLSQRANAMMVDRVRRMCEPTAVQGIRLSQSLLECVARLDDRSHEVRERASAELLGPSFSLEEILATLVRGQLSPEQHARLVAAACTRALALPRGALGIRMQSSLDPIRKGVEVSMLLPGMPAERLMRPGDRIERIGGVAIESSGDLVSLIQSRAPGESVHLTVARARRDDRGRAMLGDDGSPLEDRLELDVELADAAELDRFEARLPSAGMGDWREEVVREIRTRFPPEERRIPVADIPPRAEGSP